MQDDGESATRGVIEGSEVYGDDELDEFLLEIMCNDDEDCILGMYQYAMHIDKHLNRAELSIGNLLRLVWNGCKGS